MPPQGFLASSMHLAWASPAILVPAVLVYTSTPPPPPPLTSPKAPALCLQTQKHTTGCALPTLRFLKLRLPPLGARSLGPARCRVRFPAPDNRSPEDKRGWRQGEGAALWREGVTARAWVEKEVEMAVWVTGTPPLPGLQNPQGIFKTQTHSRASDSAGPGKAQKLAFLTGPR